MTTYILELTEKCLVVGIYVLTQMVIPWKVKELLGWVSCFGTAIPDFIGNKDVLKD